MISFFVPGIPAPGGSKNAFRVGNRIVVTDAGGKRNKAWRKAVAAAAVKAIAEYKHCISTGALRVEMIFYIQRPKSHRKGGPRYHTYRPDLLKLARSTEDALNGLVWMDDSQICEEELSKKWIEEGGSGAQITVYEESDGIF